MGRPESAKVYDTFVAGIIVRGFEPNEVKVKLKSWAVDGKLLAVENDVESATQLSETSVGDWQKVGARWSKDQLGPSIRLYKKALYERNRYLDL